MFVSSRQLTLLDHFRIPSHVDAELSRPGVEQIRPSTGGPALFWPAARTGRAIAAMMQGADRETQIPVFAHFLPDDVAESLLAEHGGGWRRVRSLAERDGCGVGSVWRSEDGSVFLPFDPDEVILNCWSERYTAITAGALHRVRRHLRMLYYRARPLLSRSVQIWLRRHFARVQARSEFPRWPVETCLHDFFDVMLAMLSDIAREPVPYIAAWPGDYTWALVLTHDVEMAQGMAALEPVLDLERAHGLRSSWNLVPRGYEIDDERVRALVAEGFEVGVHGLYHDGRDLESAATLEARLPAIRAAAGRWDCVGFRAPAMHRSWEWMPRLGFDYDLSCPDTDPFEPQAGGCCTWLPFFNEGMVELPLTMVQDHTLFVILRREDETAWIEKTEFLRRRGGMALILTHPDYLIDERIFASYGRFLERYAQDASAWRALPREVSTWWRNRAGSRIERQPAGWRVVGPAAGEARVEFFEGKW